jgi:hypothetical protein
MLTLIVYLSFLRQQEAEQRAAERIQQSQQLTMMVERAQHREIVRVQPEFHLSAEEEAGNRKAALDRLVIPK